MTTTSIDTMHPPVFFQYCSKLPRIIGLLVLTLALTACSTIKFAYNSLDDVALWWLDGYVDFTDEQEQRVREDVQRLIRWHRAQELPKMAALLRRMEEIAPDPITPDQACAFVPPLRERFLAITGRAEPAAIALMMEFEPAQIAYLEKKYAKNNSEFTKEWLRSDAAEVREKQVKQLFDRAESLYGSLGDVQRQALERHVTRSAFDPRRTFHERLRRQQDALDTVRKIAGRSVPPDEARAKLRGYLQRAQTSPDASHRAYQEAVLNDNCRGFAAVHNSTTPAQREVAVKRLRGWQRDLQELAAQP